MEKKPAKRAAKEVAANVEEQAGKFTGNGAERVKGLSRQSTEKMEKKLGESTQMEEESPGE